MDVSVDPTNGTVWVVAAGSLRVFAPDGKALATHKVNARGVDVDPAGTNAWVVTPDEILKLTPGGKILARTKRAKPSAQAWLTTLR